MRPASFRDGIESEHALVLVVGPARVAEAGEHPALDRRDVGRLEADGRTQVVVGLCVIRVGRDALLRQLDGLADLATELRVDVGRRLLEIHRRTREGAQIVVDRHCPPLEEEVQPEDVGQRAVRPRVVGRQQTLLSRSNFSAS